MGGNTLDFHYSVVSDKTVDEAVLALENSLKENRFGVLWQLDLSAKLQEKGVDYQTPFRVLEVCNPHAAKKVLTQNPLAGYFLPCKVVVYEMEGTTHIGLPKPTALIDLLGDKELVGIANEVETTLIKAIDEAK
jgi:uncharacterized protein (DUF302 family)